jgi:hypothetical protein
MNFPKDNAGTFHFDNGRLYRMPVFFGPQHGPRQLPDGFVEDHSQYPKRRMASLTCSVEMDALRALLPPRFSVRGEPSVTIEVTHISEIEWLAGRGYAILGVKTPVTYHGERELIAGDLQLVYWENLADPILSGRVEIGAPKIYCEIPDPRILRGVHSYHCAWLGFKFFELELRDLKDVDASPSAAKPHDGLMYYKYSPRTGGGVPDADYVTLSPSGASLNVVDRVQVGSGSARFHPATWEDLPTMHHVVTTLSRLALKEVVSAKLIDSHGGRDFGDQRIVA